MRNRALGLSIFLCACTASVDLGASSDVVRQSQSPQVISPNGWLFDSGGDGAGAVTVLYQQRGEAGTSLWGLRYEPDSGWGAPVLVAPSDPGIQEPILAADDVGGAVAIWTQFDFTLGWWRLWSARFAPAAGWSLPETIDTAPSGGPLQADVAIDPVGTATAVWIENGIDGSDLWTRRSTPAGGWAAPVLVASGAFELDLRDCVVNVDGAGTATLAWVNRRPLVAARSADGVVWSDAAVLDADGFVQGPMHAAADDDGNVTVAWVRDGGAGWELFASRFVPGLGWSPATAITSGGPQPAQVRVAADHTGAVTAAWMQVGAIGWDIWTGRFEGGAWSAPQPLEVEDDGTAEFVDLDVDGHGKTIAAWTQFDAEGGTIRVRRFTPGEGWGETKRYLTARDEYSAYPRVAADEHGARLVWMASVGDYRTAEQYALWSARYQ